MEAIAAETLKVMNALAGVEHLRIVCSAGSRWKECQVAPSAVRISDIDRWKGPRPREAAAYFDPSQKRAGFLSTEKSEDAVAALEIVTPAVWLALLVRAAIDRSRETVTERGRIREVLRARDEERQRIARDLHDDVGQSMTALKLSLKWAGDQLSKSKAPRAYVQEIERAEHEVASIMSKLRDLSRTLYPHSLDTLGLAPALKELAHQAKRGSSMTVNVRTEGKSGSVPQPVQLAVYRCCQEALNNAIRHSKARRVNIDLLTTNSNVRLIVEDNGVGFDPGGAERPNGILLSSGFWTIRQRLADLGGALRVSTARTQGTTVEIMIPFSKAQET